MTAETTVLFLAAAAALVTMGIYLQRAVQGGVFGVASSLGSQYDRRDPYLETQHLQMWEEVHQQTGSSMVAANHMNIPKGAYSSEDHSYNVANDTRYRDCVLAGSASACLRVERTLESLPTGRVLREPAYQLTEVTSSWNAQTDAEYRDYK